MAVIDKLRQAKAALHAAEAAHPDSQALAELHCLAGRLARWLFRIGIVTRAQVDELTTPPEAGTPKTAEPDEASDD